MYNNYYSPKRKEIEDPNFVEKFLRFYLLEACFNLTTKRVLLVLQVIILIFDFDYTYLLGIGEFQHIRSFSLLLSLTSKITTVTYFYTFETNKFFM